MHYKILNKLILFSFFSVRFQSNKPIDNTLTFVTVSNIKLYNTLISSISVTIGNILYTISVWLCINSVEYKIQSVE